MNTWYGLEILRSEKTRIMWMYPKTKESDRKPRELKYRVDGFIRELRWYPTAKSRDKVLEEEGR